MTYRGPGRITHARQVDRQINMTIIQCYAPTNDSDDIDKEDFYEQMQATFKGAHRRDILLGMGDLNAKVCSENENYERVMGKEGCKVQNDNGERLTEWCPFNNMIIGGTNAPQHPQNHLDFSEW